MRSIRPRFWRKDRTAPRQWREETLPNGRALLIYSIPFTDRTGSPYLIQAGTPYEQVESVLRQLLLSLAIALPAIIGIAVAGGGYLFMRRAIRPLDEIATTAERITSRSLNERVPVAATGDEIEKLGASLNRMMARLEESFHHIDRFSADASHELRTPLAILRRLENAQHSAELTSELRETVRSALEEAERLSRIVEQLLEMSRLEAGETLADRSRFDFVELTRTTVEQMRLMAEEKRLALNYEGAARLDMEGDRMRLKQIVVRMFDNAIKYTPPGGSISVSNFALDGKAVLEVADTGLGIPAAVYGAHLRSLLSRG